MEGFGEAEAGAYFGGELAFGGGEFAAAGGGVEGLARVFGVAAGPRAR